MSIHKNEINEMHAEIWSQYDRIKGEKTWWKWMAALTVVGILLGFIGWANYETSSWGMLLFFVGGVIGVSGVGGCHSTRNRMLESRTEIASLVAILKDRDGVDWRGEIIRRKIGLDTGTFSLGVDCPCPACEHLRRIHTTQYLDPRDV